MFCSRCGHENADDTRFCGECGAPQQEDGQEPGPYRPVEDAAESEGPDGAPEPSDIPPRDLGQLITETVSTYAKAFLPLIAFLLSIPSGAAAVFCVGDVLTGRKADIVTCYSRAFGILLPTAVVTVIVTVALAASAILMLILIGIPLFFYLLVIWFFALPVVVIEGRDGISALKRSRELTLGSWWRLLGIGVVFTLLAIAAAIPVGIVLVIASSASSNVVGVGSGVIAALLVPFFYAGSVLVYVDLRVRNEGYGTQELADDLSRRPDRMAR